MLKTRIISALVLIPIVLAALFLSPLTTAILASVGAVICTFEFYNMAARSRYNFHPLFLPGYALAASFCLAGYLRRPELMVLAAVILAVYSFLTLWLIRLFQPHINGGYYGLFGNWGLTIFAPIYAGVPLGLVVLIRAKFDGTSSAFLWILLALLGTWGTDTAAYFTGRAIGRHKLAPRISPKKTIEGAIGGIVIGTFAVTLVGTLGLNITLYLSIILGIILAIGSILGDLFESWVKRRFDIKDSGKIIPGHGGLLDRIDSFLAVALLVYLFISLYS